MKEKYYKDKKDLTFSGTKVKKNQGCSRGQVGLGYGEKKNQTDEMKAGWVGSSFVFCG